MAEIDIYKIEKFAKFARKNKLGDKMLISAAKKADEGLFYADLGRGLLKLSIAHGGKGHKGGVRAICSHIKGVVYIFLKGYSKSQESDITKAEEATYSFMGKKLLADYPSELCKALSDGSLIEIATKVETND